MEEQIIEHNNLIMKLKKDSEKNEEEHQQFMTNLIKLQDNINKIQSNLNNILNSIHYMDAKLEKIKIINKS